MGGGQVKVEEYWDYVENTGTEIQQNYWKITMELVDYHLVDQN